MTKRVNSADYKFPLKIFGDAASLPNKDLESLQYLELLRDAEEQLGEFGPSEKGIREYLSTQLGRKLEILNSRLGPHGAVEAYLSAPNLPDSFKTPLEALNYAKQHGVSGWYRLPDFLDLVSASGGIIAKSAMFQMGWRPYYNVRCKKKTGWEKSSENSPGIYFAKQFWKDRVLKECKECKGLQECPGKSVLSLEERVAGEPTYSFIVGKGIKQEIAGSTVTDPSTLFFYVDDWKIHDPNSSKFPLWGHITPQQKGFLVSARNIKLTDPEQGVYLKVTKNQEVLYEVILANQMPQHQFSAVVASITEAGRYQLQLFEQRESPLPPYLFNRNPVPATHSANNSGVRNYAP